MSLLAIATPTAAALPQVNFHPHGHRRGSHLDAATESGSSTAGQLPVAAAQNLFGSLLQSLEQVIGNQTTTAATATTPATAASAATTPATTDNPISPTGPTAPVTQNFNGFVHSLFHILKQDVSAIGAGTAAAATTASSAVAGGAATAAAGAGQYLGSLTSSLQTLIQQVGANGSASPALANLDASFKNLVQGISGSASAAGGSASQASSAGLHNFLSNLLQNLQASGLQTPKLTGSNVNANA